MVLHNELDGILKSFQNKKILIIGDVMVDEYLWGNVARISPEAPVPIVSCTKREYRLGGAANVALNVRAMGAEPYICSIIGDDDAGNKFLQILREQKISGEGILSSPKRETTLKTRIIGNHQHLLRCDQEITSFLDQELEKLLVHRVKELFDTYSPDAIVFQDYDKGILTKAIIDELTLAGNKKEIPILVDPKKRNFRSYRNITLFKPNFKEFSEGLNNNLISKHSQNDLFDAANILHWENEIKIVMVTLSEKGIFVSDGKQNKIFPAIKRDIADVSGAGDTVICLAALSLAADLDAFQTAELANLAGGIVCEKVGVVPITPEFLLNEKRNLS